MFVAQIAMTTEIEPIRCHVSSSSLGTMTVAATEKSICAILFGDGAATLTVTLENRFPGAMLINGDNEFNALANQAARLINKPSGSVDFPLEIRGTDFQHHVWQALRGIQPEKTTSDKEVAMQIGAPKAVRAIALACAANPLAVAIPYHRLIRSDGLISGYRWGTARKRALLDHEACL